MANASAVFCTIEADYYSTNFAPGEKSSPPIAKTNCIRYAFVFMDNRLQLFQYETTNAFA